MDVVRERLGDEKLTYLGFSYGTYLGSLYAALFPDRVRDRWSSTVPSTRPSTRVASTLLQAPRLRDEPRPVPRVVRRHPRLRAPRWRPPGAGLRRAPSADRRHADRRRREPGRAIGPGPLRQLNDTRFDAAVLMTLYSGRAAWPGLAGALAEADGGHGDQLLVAADRFFGREPGGGDDGSVEAFWAVGCLDDPTSADVGGLQTRAAQVAPRLGAFVANFSLACTVWPTHPDATSTTLTSPAPSFAGAASGALAVVGTANDPCDPARRRRSAWRTCSATPRSSSRRGTVTPQVGSGNARVDGAVARYPRVARRMPRPSTAPLLSGLQVAPSSFRAASWRISVWCVNGARQPPATRAMAMITPIDVPRISPSTRIARNARTASVDCCVHADRVRRTGAEHGRLGRRRILGRRMLGCQMLGCQMLGCPVPGRRAVGRRRSVGRGAGRAHPSTTSRVSVISRTARCGLLAGVAAVAHAAVGHLGRPGTWGPR